MGTKVIYWIERRSFNGEWWEIGEPHSRLEDARIYHDRMAEHEPREVFRIAEVTTVTVIVE